MKISPRHRTAFALTRGIAVGLTCVFLAGCYAHKIDTLETWCEQVNGVDLEEKYRPFWAVIFSVKIERDAVRDDFVKLLNDTYMKKAQKRFPKMAWREGMVLHLINPSSLFVVEPSEFISDWRKGIAKAQSSTLMDPADKCLWSATFSLFDSVEIHSAETDPVSANWGDSVTAIPTDRKKIYAKYHVRGEEMDGWYLVIPALVEAPPVYPACSHGLKTNVDAPLTQWEIEGSFYTVKECETKKSLARAEGATVVQEAEKKVSGMRKESPNQWSWSAPLCSAIARGKQMSEATCVSADDPRLVGR